MIRTIFHSIILCATILWLPWWASMALFVFGAIVLRYAFVLVIPALLADALYAPHTVHSTLSFFYNHLTVLIVLVLLLGRYSILAKTRVSLL